MKHIHKVFALVAAMAAIEIPSAVAQDGMEVLVKEGIQDGKYLLTGYLDPFMKSASLALNQGWYNTAKPHKVPGFDLTITANAMFIPSSDLFYTVDNARLTQVELISPTTGRAPTIFGPDQSPTYRVKNNSETFTGPAGLDLKGNIKANVLPVPIANIGIGLPKNTDLKIRYSPTLDIGDDGTFNLFGVGVMHSVKQYIPGIKLLPFDLSAFVGYTRMKIESDLSGNFSDFGTRQRGEFQINSTTIQGIASKQFSVLTLYGALGYNIAKSNLSMKGTYDFNENGTVDQNEVDPVDLKFAASGPRMTAGFRLKLAVITLHADYTLQKYKSLSVGFGINVR